MDENYILLDYYYLASILNMCIQLIIRVSLWEKYITLLSIGEKTEVPRGGVGSSGKARASLTPWQYAFLKIKEGSSYSTGTGFSLIH